MAPGLEREIDGERACRVELHVALHDLLEALQLRADVVQAGQQVRERVVAAAVGDGRACRLRLVVGGADGHARHDAAGRILHDTGHLTAFELGVHAAGVESSSNATPPAIHRAHLARVEN